ncbi:YlxR family protein [bacterium]|nr:MAG: YlxR family protein [bacterium]
MEKTTPLRTCIACRRKENRTTLLRIARDTDGRLGLWKGSGRSAYCHPTAACFEAALGKGRLERALRGPVTPPEREALKTEIVCQLR